MKKEDTSGHIDNLPEFPNNFPKQVKYKIALFHGTVTNCTLQNYSTSSSGYPIEWFKDYDFGIFGDVHLMQVNRNEKLDLLWGYSGSLVQQNFGEMVEDHGMLHWDISKKKVAKINIHNPYRLLNIKFDKERDYWYITQYYQ